MNYPKKHKRIFLKITCEFSWKSQEGFPENPKRIYLNKGLNENLNRIRTEVVKGASRNRSELNKNHVCTVTVLLNSTFHFSLEVKTTHVVYCHCCSRQPTTTQAAIASGNTGQSSFLDVVCSKVENSLLPRTRKRYKKNPNCPARRRHFFFSSLPSRHS